jgi:hypothetical protein
MRPGIHTKTPGFSILEPAQVDALFADLIEEANDDADTMPNLSQQAVTRSGDLWILANRHRLLCEDARHTDYRQLIQDERAGMIFADVPYRFEESGWPGPRQIS